MIQWMMIDKLRFQFIIDQSEASALKMNYKAKIVATIKSIIAPSKVLELPR